MAETRYPPEKLAKYPHMFPRDIVIWERFVEKLGRLYDSFSYDVKVGTGRPENSDWSENIKRMNYILSTFRIDAVSHKGSKTTLFEVKPDAGPSAIGQILCYGELYERDKTSPETAHLAIITNRATPDIAHLCAVFNIELYIL